MNKISFESQDLLISRVKKYLQNNVNKSYIDIKDMADELQIAFNEYGIQNKDSFRNKVKKAYDIVLKDYNYKCVGSSSEELSEDNMEDSGEHLIYRHHSKNAKEGDTIPINISSDEEDDPDTISLQNCKYTNGASTSQKLAGSQMHHILNTNLLENENVSYQQAVKERKRKRIDVEDTNSVSAKNLTSSIKQTHNVKVTFDCIGGSQHIIFKVCKYLMNFKHQTVYNNQLRISPLSGLLIHGPPGCGKTLLANAIAGELGIPLLSKSVLELLTNSQHTTEERIKYLFKEASYFTSCVLFIDELDTFNVKNANSHKYSSHVFATHLLQSLKELKEKNRNILFIGATRDIDLVDPVLRKPEGFSKEIQLEMPNLNSRIGILEVLTKKLKVASDINFQRVAALTPGFSGAKLLSLVEDAADIAIERHYKLVRQQNLKENTNVQQDSNVTNIQEKREAISSESVNNYSNNLAKNSIVIIDDDIKIDSTKVPQVSNEKNIQEATESLNNIDINVHHFRKWISAPSSSFKVKDDSCLTTEDFITVLKSFNAFSQVEDFVTFPDVKWDDVGSLNFVKEDLQLAVVAPLKHPLLLTSALLTAPQNTLLCGPPGCGKTLLVKAVANEAEIGLISIRGSKLLCMYLEGGKESIHRWFELVHSAAPCVVFFDQLDIFLKTFGSEEKDKITNLLNIEFDIIKKKCSSIFVLAATNQPDQLSTLLLHNFEVFLYVGIPTAVDRENILKTITRHNPKLASDVDLGAIARFDQCEGFTGADLQMLVKEAVKVAVKDLIYRKVVESIVVNSEHFNKAFLKVRRSIPVEEVAFYESMKLKYSSVSTISSEEEMEYS